jgi:hypothetical protein
MARRAPKAGDVFVHHGARAHGYRDTVNLGLINVIYEPSLLQKVRFDVVGFPGWFPGYQSLVVVEPAMRREGRHLLTLGIRKLARARHRGRTGGGCRTALSRSQLKEALPELVPRC